MSSLNNDDLIFSRSDEFSYISHDELYDDVRSTYSSWSSLSSDGYDFSYYGILSDNDSFSGEESFFDSISSPNEQEISEDSTNTSVKKKTKRSNTTTVHNDGYKWRKYGQKSVKGSSFPRNYFKCAVMDCPAKKQIEKYIDENGAEREKIKYVNNHSHGSQNFSSTIEDFSKMNFLQLPRSNFKQNSNRRGRRRHSDDFRSVQTKKVTNIDEYRWRKYDQNLMEPHHCQHCQHCNYVKRNENRMEQFTLDKDHNVDINIYDSFNNLNLNDNYWETTDQNVDNDNNNDIVHVVPKIFVNDINHPYNESIKPNYISPKINNNKEINFDINDISQQISGNNTYYIPSINEPNVNSTQHYQTLPYQGPQLYYSHLQSQYGNEPNNN